jgi:hypothetical protein
MCGCLMSNDSGDADGPPAGKAAQNAGARRRSRHIVKDFRE